VNGGVTEMGFRWSACNRGPAGPRNKALRTPPPTPQRRLHRRFRGVILSDLQHRLMRGNRDRNRQGAENPIRIQRFESHRSKAAACCGGQPRRIRSRPACRQHRRSPGVLPRAGPEIVLGYGVDEHVRIEQRLPGIRVDSVEDEPGGNRRRSLRRRANARARL
jgi:hypothetical protein